MKKAPNEVRPNLNKIKGPTHFFWEPNPWPKDWRLSRAYLSGCPPFAFVKSDSLSGINNNDQVQQLHQTNILCPKSLSSNFDMAAKEIGVHSAMGSSSSSLDNDSTIRTAKTYIPPDVVMGAGSKTGKSKEKSKVYATATGKRTSKAPYE